MLISAADRFIRFRLYLGAEIETVYAQVIKYMRIPIAHPQLGVQREISRDIFQAHYQNLPTIDELGVRTGKRSEGKVVKSKGVGDLTGFEFSETAYLSDQELDSESYAERYGFLDYIEQEESAKVAKAAYFWSQAEVRKNLCAAILRGSMDSSVAYTVSENTGIAVTAEDVRVFRAFFWDLSSLSDDEALLLLQHRSMANVTRYAATGGGASLRSKLGIETVEESTVSRMRMIRNFAAESIEKLAFDPDTKGHAKELKTLAEVYMMATQTEAALEEAKSTAVEGRTPGTMYLAESINSDGLAATDAKAIMQWGEVVLQRAERAQREDELDFVEREGLMSVEEVDELRMRLDQGEDIGLRARDLMNDFLKREEQGSGDILDEL